jgi:hypothetical protein
MKVDPITGQYRSVDESRYCDERKKRHCVDGVSYLDAQ